MSDLENYESNIDSIINRFRSKLDNVKRHRVEKTQHVSEKTNDFTPNDVVRSVHVKRPENDFAKQNVSNLQNFHVDRVELTEGQLNNLKRTEPDAYNSSFNSKNNELEDLRFQIEQLKIEHEKELNYIRKENEERDKEARSFISRVEKERDEVACQLYKAKEETKFLREELAEVKADKEDYGQKINDLKRIHSELIQKKIEEIDYYTKKLKHDPQLYKNEFIVKCLDNFFKNSFGLALNQNSVGDLIKMLDEKLNPIETLKEVKKEENVDWKLLAQRYIKTIEQQKSEIARYQQIHDDKKKKKKVVRKEEERPLRLAVSRERTKGNCEEMVKIDSIKDRLDKLESKIRLEAGI